MRVGIIGCGNVTMVSHLPALQSLAGLEVCGAADPTPECLTAVQEFTGLTEENCHADWRDMLARSDVDAVVVATPQRSRPGIAIAAARAGKHLLCEKPLALAPIDAHRMVEAARQNGVTLATVHNYVHIPVYRAMKQLLVDGAIGRLEVATLNFLSVEDRPGTATYQPRWRHDVGAAGGGVLMDMLHAVYLAAWLFGEQPTAVSATVDRRSDNRGDVEDFALVRYDFPTGHALVNIAWGHGPGGTTLMGTTGRALLLTEQHGTHPFVEVASLRTVNAAGEHEVPFERGFGGSFAGVWSDFRDAAATGRPALAPGETGAATLEAVVGAYASAAFGRDVPLPLDPSDPVYQEGAVGLAKLRISPQSRVWQRNLYGVRH